MPENVASHLDQDTRWRFLVDEIQARLYDHFYLQGHATPVAQPVVRQPVIGVDDFVRSLADANHGSGTWSKGWNIAERAEDVIWARNDGLTVRVRPEEYRTDDASDDSVFVHLPKDFPAQSPGFYLAQSEEPFEPALDDILVRLYWHVTPDGAIRLIDSVTSQLNAARVPFHVKVLNDPGAYRRNDTGVLYIGKRDLSGAAVLFQRIYQDVQDELLPTEPALTKRLVPGLGLAEDPRNGESFGLHRCRLLAEAFVEAAGQGITDPIEKLRKAEERFEREGLDMSRPYLNPGSVDDYDMLLNISPWHRAADAAPSSAGDITSDIPISDETELRSQYVQTASEIGDRLVEDAIWYDGRCTWLGKLESQTDPHDPSRIAPFGTIGPDVYTGTAGIALFLAQLSAETGNDRFAGTARAAINQAIHTIDQLQRRGSWGFYTGWPGVAVYATCIGQLLGDHALLREAPARFGEQFLGLAPKSEPDLLSGMAGTLVALVALSRMTGNERLMVEAVGLGDQLLLMARRRGKAIWWSVQTQAGRRGVTGFAHGAAGIAFALLELFAATQEYRFREAAAAAFSFERRNFHPGLRNWLDLRYPVEGSRFGPAALVSSVWCHGSGGIAISRLTAWNILRERVYLDEAETAIAATSAWLESLLPVSDRPWSLCHGLCGNADILLWAAESLPEQALTLRRLARRVAGAGIEALARANEAGEPLNTDEPGLMLGAAGIGHFYLRLANPTIPSILIPSAASFAPQPQG